MIIRQHSDNVQLFVNLSARKSQRYMVVRKCAKCGRLVWFWQNRGELELALKNGKSKTVCLCIDCGIKKAHEMQGLLEDIEKATGGRHD